MSIRNHNWLNAQATRRYPLDDNATGTGDDGTRLKDDIIVDLHMRWPKLAGQYAFLGGLTVTNNIITAVILAADSPTAAANFTPLAAVTVVQPVNRHQFYNLEPLYPGVGGFIAFGDVSETFSIRFSTPQQGLLAPKIGRPYDSLPIPTMRKFGRADGLVGLVKILAGPDVEVVKEKVITDEQDDEVDALVIRLVNPTSARNVLSDYIGPCGKRPESRNCAREGVETINGVGPDCDGNLEIEFVGLVAGPYDNCGSEGAGVTLDQSLGIDDVCTAQDPERFAGSDYCVPASASSLSSEGSVPSQPSLSLSSSSASAGSSEAVQCEELPFVDCFDTPIHPSWDVKLGSYNLVAADSPGENCLTPATCYEQWSAFSSFSSVQSGSSSLSCPSLSSSSGQSLSSCSLGVRNWIRTTRYAVPWSSESSYSCFESITQAVRLNDSSRRNVMVWEDCGIDSSFAKKVTTHLKLTNGASRRNGGVIMNYHLVDPFTNPHVEYFIAQINQNDNRVELVRYNGASLILENFVTPGVPFSFTDWYEITAEAQDEGGGNTRITVTVNNVSSPGWPQVSFSLLTNRWGNDDGHYGIHTNRAITDFSFWGLEDA